MRLIGVELELVLLRLTLEAGYLHREIFFLGIVRFLRVLPIS